MVRKAKVSKKESNDDAGAASHQELSQDVAQSSGPLEHETRSGLHYVDAPAEDSSSQAVETSKGRGSGGIQETMKTEATALNPSVKAAPLVKSVIYTIPHPPKAKTIGELQQEAAKRYSVPADNLFILDAKSKKPLEMDIKLEELDGDLLVQVLEKSGGTKDWIFSFVKGKFKPFDAELSQTTEEPPKEKLEALPEESGESLSGKKRGREGGDEDDE